LAEWTRAALSSQRLTVDLAGAVKRETDRIGIGHLIALFASAGLIVALFRPWYSLHIPPELFQAVVGSASSLGIDPQRLSQASAMVAQQLAAHPPTVNAWQAFEYVDVALACICAAVASLTLARLLLPGASLPGLHKLVSGLGLVATALVVYRIAVHPGPGDTFAGHALLRLENGAWLALAAAVAIAVGGRLGAPRRASAVHGAAAPAAVNWPKTSKTWAGS
jgi:hypothetical protein